MSDVQKFKSVVGSFQVIDSEGGGFTFSISGSRPPNELKDLPDYLAQCAKKSLSGATDSEVSDLKKQIAELKATVDKKIEEISTLKAHSPAKSAAMSNKVLR